MPRKTSLAIGAVVAGIIVVGGAAAIAGEGGDEAPLTGSTLEQASAAALAEVGGGRVLESEIGDGGVAYEVEVVREDGSVVGVSLDESFTVIEMERDDDAGAAGADDD
jgi:hypothetical protein